MQGLHGYRSPSKGMVINYGKRGGGGATKWENHGSETFCAPPPRFRGWIRWPQSTISALPTSISALLTHISALLTHISALLTHISALLTQISALLTQISALLT